MRTTRTPKLSRTNKTTSEGSNRMCSRQLCLAPFEIHRAARTCALMDGREAEA
eukprot:NODE_21269_length_255_cov_1.927184_g20100_i0.p4 GENE.NODE_21269_length_255_cov_1.927184_g20100_i0~~NODE_21269_length_255_cov_1.927184_g20100_i0.p4  ORF type:complete len:53 (-),score=1.34 NODE_21269_length_255_cov_1.927184_g20100_i0:31-189(-)